MICCGQFRFKLLTICVLMLSCYISKISAQTPTFTDVTGIANAGVTNAATGVAWGDYNGDGFEDILIVHAANTGPSLLKNNGNGTFSTDQVNADVNFSQASSAGIWGDYNNDGHLDLYISSSGNSNKLFRNDGDGTFTDVSIGSGVNDSGPGRSAAWADYDRDGWLDLARSKGSQGVVLFRNKGDGSFEDVTAAVNMTIVGATIIEGLAWGDFNNDYWPDLFLTGNNGANNNLFKNNGNDTFTDIAVNAGVQGSGSGRAVSWGDYNNDGFLDIYVGNTNHQDHLFRNNKNGTFDDMATSANINGNTHTEGVDWGDYDNDGFLDLYIVEQNGANKLFRNNGNNTFSNLAASANVDDGGTGETAAWGDYDNDGDLDLYITIGTTRLFKNDLVNSKWLHVKTIGSISNRTGIGATIIAVTPTHRQRRDVNGGSGYLAQPSLPAEFGFGGVATVDSLIICWPSGINQVLTNIPTNQILTVTEPLNFSVTLTLGMDLGTSGDTLCVPVTLTNPNTGPVGGFQFDVINSNTSASTFKGLADTTAHPGFSYASNTFGDTTRIVVHSNSGAVIQPGTDLPVMTLKYCLTGNAALGSTIDLTLSGIEIGDSSGVAFPDLAVHGTLNIGIRGDVNLDEKVSILDVIKLVRIIIGSDPAPADGTTAFKIADANADGNLNITDVITQINNILGVNPKITVTGPSSPVIASLGLPQADEAGRTVIPLQLSTDGLIAGMQATLQYDPTRIQIESPYLAEQANGMVIDSHLQNGVMRLLVYAPSPGQGIDQGSEAVVYIPVTIIHGETALTLTDISLSNSRAQLVAVTVSDPVINLSARDATLPGVFSLSSAHPNPFNPSTSISYTVPQQAHITLTVYNVLGQEVIRLVDEVKAPGRYEVTWQGVNSQGASVASGVYVYRMNAGAGFTDTKRMTLLK